LPRFRADYAPKGVQSARCFSKSSLRRDSIQSRRVLGVAIKLSRPSETADPQGLVRSGLTALQDLSIEQFGHGFLAVGGSQQIKLIKMISSASRRARCESSLKYSGLKQFAATTLLRKASKISTTRATGITRSVPPVNRNRTSRTKKRSCWRCALRLNGLQTWCRDSACGAVDCLR